MKGIVQGSFGLLVLGQIEPAYGSGGATAGGVYLLSAKQRYNKRVTSGLKAFLALDVNDISAVNAFFETKDEGGWEDLSAAAYLLANAFRTNSSKAPDSLPSVKSWKAFSTVPACSENSSDGRRDLPLSPACDCLSGGGPVDAGLRQGGHVWATRH